ncbi:MAG: hypothetical protein NTV32_05625, partial [Gammaproteobacteria bacterium]|nr:hypothetical protein [Gammaproteobacteria bacterium]
MQGYWKTSELEGENATYLDMLYEVYLDDPTAVDAKWQAYFAALGPVQSDLKHSDVQQAFVDLAKHPQFSVAASSSCAEDAYRQKGHLLAKIDPLNLLKLPQATDLGLDENLVKFKAMYADKIGYEFMHIEDDARREWLRERIEAPRKALS